ncbi:MAG: HAD family hydrolase [Alphaproteobacteria bacterium]
MKNNISLPKAIFYDWDGTLADSYKFLEGAHNHVRRELGLAEFKGEEFKAYFGHPREKLYNDLYGHEIEKAKTLFGDYVTKYHMENLKPMPGAKELLDAGKNLGILMGIISNKKAEFLRQEIRGFGWEGYFGAVVGAGDAPRDKPAADPLIKVAHEAGIMIADSWYVGDTDVDLQCAQNASCASVFLAHDSRSDEWTKLYKPFLIFKNCHLMAEFLLQCPKNKIKAG